MNSNPIIIEIKKKIFPLISGNVLETAVGESSNLDYYDKK